MRTAHPAIRTARSAVAEARNPVGTAAGPTGTAHLDIDAIATGLPEASVPAVVAAIAGGEGPDPP